MDLSFERFIQNCISGVILNVLPASVAMSEIVSLSRKTNKSTEAHKILQMGRSSFEESVVRM